jgi:hypothetical protein
MSFINNEKPYLGLRISDTEAEEFMREILEEYRDGTLS